MFDWSGFRMLRLTEVDMFQITYKFKLFAISLLLLLMNVVRAQDKVSRLKILFDTLNARGNFNGCVLVAERGKVLFQAPYGEAGDAGQLLNNGSIFELASVTKTFTAMAIMQLKEKGLLSYEDSLRKFFPKLPYQGVTVRDLINHTSGIEDFLAWTEGDIDVTRINSNEDIIRRLVVKNKAAAFPPGSKLAYSNTNYALLASIIEQVSGAEFADYLNRNIFLPCGMNNTKVNASHSGILPKNYAFDYSWDGSQNRFIRSDSLKRYTYYLSGVTGAYGVVSTVDDLYKWDQALANNLLVKEATMKEALTPVTLKNANNFIELAPGIPLAFMWQLLPSPTGYMDMFASGSYGGYTSLIVRKLVKGQTVILLSNNIESSPVTTIIPHIEDILEGGALTFPERITQKRGIQLSVDELRPLIGSFVATDNPSRHLKITMTNGRLYVKFVDSMEQNIFPESGDTFFINGSETRLIFGTIEHGKARSLRVVDPAFETTLKRVE